MKFTASGIIRRGKVALDDRWGYERGVAKFEDGEAILLRVESLQRHRSIQQNKFWHAVVVKYFAEHCGYDHDEMHEVLKAELLPEIRLIHNAATGEVIREVKTYGSTSALSTAEFNDLIERAQRLGAEMGVVIPDPSQVLV